MTWKNMFGKVEATAGLWYLFTIHWKLGKVIILVETVIIKRNSETV
jgi:hypothetical protein